MAFLHSVLYVYRRYKLVHGQFGDVDLKFGKNVLQGIVRECTFRVFRVKLGQLRD